MKLLFIYMCKHFIQKRGHKYNKKMKGRINPFLFIRLLFCPSCIHASLSLNCLKLTIPGFPHNCLPVSWGDNGFKKILGLVLAWNSGLKVSTLSAFRALLPFENYSAEWSGRVWQPSADSNSLLAHHYCQQRSITPDPESLNSNKKGSELPLISAEGCHTRLEGQHCPLITYQGVFFKGGETLW